jgi:hypothetical protein
MASTSGGNRSSTAGTASRGEKSLPPTCPAKAWRLVRDGLGVGAEYGEICEASGGGFRAAVETGRRLGVAERADRAGLRLPLLPARPLPVLEPPWRLLPALT